jgi:hypothetical protein
MLPAETIKTEKIELSKTVSRVSIFGLELTSWEHLMLLSLGIAGLVAVAVFVTTASVVILQRRDNAQTKREYEEYKLTVDAKVAEAKREGIAAGKSAGDALVRAAALEKEAQELKAANLALEARIQPRRLTGENSRRLSEVLSSAPPAAVAVVSRLFDPEGVDFSDDLATAIGNGHWQTARYRSWTRSEKGVFIATVEGTPLPLSVAILRAALDAANVKYSVSTISADDHTMSPWFQPNVLYLLVGAKP